ncbi:hypothetical protein EmuJ_000066900 [Echinococcus multilocularis]|uniref:Uncharacterized protein n=1 Tax=Echinococcus multilocularis TaxID=6211 RepID=A0A087VXQ7_ECHMU|nr:hypothetical protein EmuJ_000066900 [Echinococcus multilocularis]
MSLCEFLPAPFPNHQIQVQSKPKLKLKNCTYSFDKCNYAQPHVHVDVRVLQSLSECENHHCRKLYGRRTLGQCQKVNLYRCLSLGSKGRTWLSPKPSSCSSNSRTTSYHSVTEFKLPIDLEDGLL